MTDDEREIGKMACELATAINDAVKSPSLDAALEVKLKNVLLRILEMARSDGG